jgi:DNA-binding MarR family transcriptional regulator
MTMKTIEKKAGKQELTATEQKMLSYIAYKINRTGCQPSMREIATELGYSSPGYVPKLVDSCQAKGYIKAQHGARAIEFAWREFV